MVGVRECVDLIDPSVDESPPMEQHRWQQTVQHGAGEHRVSAGALGESQAGDEVGGNDMNGHRSIRTGAG